MSNDDKKTLESDPLAVDPIDGHSIAVSGVTAANATEKRTLPLLYVQSPVNKSNTSDNSNDSSKPKNLTKLVAPVTVSPVSNGVTTSTKLVQVQTPSPNIAYVGTFFKPSSKGKDKVPQKVLLTPVKGKEVSMTRLILPRPPTPSPQGMKICRSFVVSPVTQASIIKPNDSTSTKLVQPNIIRQRGVEAKILTNAVVMPATASNTSVPSGLTVVKSYQLNQTGDKQPMKVLLMDIEDNYNNENTRISDEMTGRDDTGKPLVKAIDSEREGTKPVCKSSDNEKTIVENKTASQWDEKDSSNFPFQSTGDRARKRKGSLLSPVCGTPKKVFIGDPYENIKLFPGAEEYDPFKIIDWDNQGLGNLPNSSIKIIKNEFDMVELLEGGESIDKRNSDEIFCCLSCGCYGLISEFYNENYCSIGCRDELMALQHSIFNKKQSTSETFEVSDKKRTYENVGMKMVCDESKRNQIPEKTSVPGGNEISLLKTNDSEIIDLANDNSSVESEPAIKKSINEETRLTKMKKIITKGYKISRKSEVSNSSESNEGKNKIKLRPRNSSKIYKSSSSEDFMAQDLDLGSSNVDNESSTKKKSTPRFRWNVYCSETKSSGAWVKLFNNPFPSKPNRFKVGQRLESIDPEHQSHICLVSIAELKGYRLKLHFDGYPKDYDFWVNADNPNLFPSEFCSKHKIPLLLPPDWSMKNFDWDSYLSRHNAKAAPQSCFENNSSCLDQVNLFKVDMKLEAVDRKNTYLVCVATVAAVMENRILVHFDSWDEMYDYWVDISSPYIRPVGWCKSSKHQLTPPNGIKPVDFSWKKYLKDTNSIAAPEKAFVLRPPIEFKKGMKIEAVDKRAPHLVRVATISEVLPYQVKITFDGFPAHFGYWVDDDCLDIHPVGWCSRGGHPLEPPPSAEDFINSSCPTPGCIGQGYYQGTKREHHKLTKNCPYTTVNLLKDPVPTGRLKWSTKSYRRNSDNAASSMSEDSSEESEEEPEEKKWAWMKVRQRLKKGVTRETGIERVIISKPDCGMEVDPKAADTSRNSEIYKICSEKKETGSKISKFNIEKKEFSLQIPKICAEKKEPDLQISKVTAEKKESSYKAYKVNDDKKQPTLQVSNSAEKKELNPKIPNVNFEQKESTSGLTQEDNSAENESVENKKKPIKEEKESCDDCSSDDGLNTTPKVEELELAISNNIKEEQMNISIESIPDSPTDTEKSISPLKPSTENLNNINGIKDFNPVNMITNQDDNNPLYWSIHQVSEFTRPLITCSKDCFLEEEIDGQGLLMLSKTDLLDYLGLSVSDAERVYSSINMLRQKAV